MVFNPIYLNTLKSTEETGLTSIKKPLSGNYLFSDIFSIVSDEVGNTDIIDSFQNSAFNISEQINIKEKLASLIQDNYSCNLIIPGSETEIKKVLNSILYEFNVTKINESEKTDSKESELSQIINEVNNALLNNNEVKIELTLQNGTVEIKLSKDDLTENLSNEETNSEPEININLSYLPLIPQSVANEPSLKKSSGKEISIEKENILIAHNEVKKQENTQPQNTNLGQQKEYKAKSFTPQLSNYVIKNNITIEDVKQELSNSIHDSDSLKTSLNLLEITESIEDTSDTADIIDIGDATIKSFNSGSLEKVDVNEITPVKTSVSSENSSREVNISNDTNKKEEVDIKNIPSSKTATSSENISKDIHSLKEVYSNIAKENPQIKEDKSLNNLQTAGAKVDEYEVKVNNHLIKDNKEIKHKVNGEVIAFKDESNSSYNKNNIVESDELSSKKISAIIHQNQVEEVDNSIIPKGNRDTNIQAEERKINKANDLNVKHSKSIPELNISKEEHKTIEDEVKFALNIKDTSKILVANKTILQQNSLEKISVPFKPTPKLYSSHKNIIAENKELPKVENISISIKDVSTEKILIKKDFEVKNNFENHIDVKPFMVNNLMKANTAKEGFNNNSRKKELSSNSIEPQSKGEMKPIELVKEEVNVDKKIDIKISENVSSEKTTFTPAQAKSTIEVVVNNDKNLEKISEYSPKPFIDQKETNAQKKSKGTDKESKEIDVLSGNKQEQTVTEQKPVESVHKTESKVNYEQERSIQIDNSFKKELAKNIETKAFQDINVSKEEKNVHINNIYNELKTVITEKSNKSLSFNLMPEELGKMKIDVETTDKNVVNAKIEVQSEQVKTIVQTNIEQLKSTLNNSGVSINNVYVSVANQEQKSGKPFDQKKKTPSGNAKGYTEKIDAAADVKKLGYNTYEYLA